LHSFSTMKIREEGVAHWLLEVGLDRVHAPPGGRVTVGVIEEARILREELEVQLQHLQRERERSSFLFDAAPFACLATDASGRMSEVNRAAARLFGVPARRLIGTQVVSLVAEGSQEEVRTRLAAIVHADTDGWQRWTCAVRRGNDAVRTTVTVRLARAATPESRVFWIMRERKARGAPNP
jgi:PAS domain S-box-containing protein